MPRFRFNADALAVDGHITRPFNRQIDPQASCVLPSDGGRASATAGAFRLTDPSSGRLVLAFDSADSSASGEESPAGIFATVVYTTIRNLNVLDVLKADEVTCRYTLSYDLAARRVSIDAAGAQFVNLTIGGQAPDVSLDYTMARDASDYDAFKRKHPELKESQGKIHYSLARGRDPKYDTTDFGYYDVADFGRIYFAEWTAAHDTQTLSMMRLQLGSPVAGSVMLASSSGNGSPFPP